MKALVTGGAGFIGSHLCESLLKRGFEVSVVDNFSTGHSDNLKNAQKLSSEVGLKLEVLHRDISDAKLWQSLGSFEAVYHLASEASDDLATEALHRQFQSNVSPWWPMVQWMRRHRPRFFLNASSAEAIYGESLYFPTDERVPTRPKLPLGATKAFGTFYLSALANVLKESGEWSSDPKHPNFVTWVTLNFSTVYGPRQTVQSGEGVIAECLERLLRGEAPVFHSDGSRSRDFIFIDDVVRLVEALHGRSAHANLDEIFNVASGEEVKDLGIFDTLMDTLEKHCRNTHDLEVQSRLHAVKEAIFVPKLPGQVQRSCLTAEKAKAFAGWRPEVSFDRGIAQTIAERLAPKILPR